MRVLVLLFIASIVGLWAIGEIVLYFNPASEIDRTCLDKTPAELWPCVAEARHAG